MLLMGLAFGVVRPSVDTRTRPSKHSHVVFHAGDCQGSCYFNINYNFLGFVEMIYNRTIIYIKKYSS